MKALRAEPDWHEAAQTLVDGCCLLAPAERVPWLEQLCRAIGDPLYPAFLRVLCLVGEHGEPLAQRAVAATLNDALASGRLPSGPQAAWGALAGASRRQGPIEFLCAAFLHPQGALPLSASAFDRTARALLGLMAQDVQAHARYRARLEAAAADPLEGAWSRADRAALRALAAAWAPGAVPGLAVDAFLQAARGGAGSGGGWSGLPGFGALGPPGR